MISELILTVILAGYDPKLPQCVRWTWQGPYYNRKIKCLQWRELPVKQPKK